MFGPNWMANGLVDVISWMLWHDVERANPKTL